MDERLVLSESEYDLLRRMVEKRVSKAKLDDLPNIIELDKSTIASLSELLQSKDVLRILEKREKKYVLTGRGVKVLRDGLPEENLVKLVSQGVTELRRIREKLGDEAGIAIGIARRNGWITISGGIVELAKPIDDILREVEEKKSLLREVAEKGFGESKLLSELIRRGLVREEEVVEKIILTAKRLVQVLEEATVEKGRLTHQDLKTGRWARVKLRKYDVSAEPPDIRLGRRHFLSEFLDMLRDLMKELGFTEAEGPLVELELYNFDLLFQPQDHPAREVHDTLWIRDPIYGRLEGLEDLVERVRHVHEKGWGYKWSTLKASKHVLRSQTTSVSARVITSKPEPPIRYFSLGRVFRSDVIDASHLPEFHQLDGIMGDELTSFRDLLGMLTEISERLGFRIRFKPGYFPFTEPSVEGYVKLPNGKWLELFGAGMFRPEVLEMAGIDYPVVAWGFGVERLAAAYYGLTDIRMLYSRDIDFISDFPVRRMR
ncbi:MAG: phenylalanine--tRNA ligase subunit alpha [Desulfurococcales archaeon]|nr:phenylalanine--tRNA ligase subunit alpha [Desulfurococcales archaeon]